MHGHMQRALEALNEATATLSLEQIARPIPGKWSIGGILEHLMLAYQQGADSLERALASGECRARPPSTREWLARTLVIDIGYFPRVRAPAAAEPQGTVAPEHACQHAKASLTALDDALTRAALRFGGRRPVLNHPYFAGLSVDQWRRFHLRHTRHHMEQVRARARIP